MRRPLAALALVAVVLAVRSAAADGARPAMQVDVEPCVGIPAAPVRRGLEIELDALLVEARDGAAVDITRVRITCEGSLVRIAVDDRLSGKLLSRRIDLARESPASRPRLLALSVVELVTASWLELRMRSSTTPAFDARASDDARRTAAASVSRRVPLPAAPDGWWWAMSGVGRRFSQPFPQTLGLAIAAERPVWHGLSLRGDLGLDVGSDEVSLGRVRALLASSGLAAVVTLELGRVGLQAGAGVRGGAVQLAGTPAAGAIGVVAESPIRTWGGPFITLATRVRVASSIAAHVGVESGIVAWSVAGLAGGRPETSLDGAWVAVVAGIAFHSSSRSAR